MKHTRLTATGAAAAIAAALAIAAAAPATAAPAKAERITSAEQLQAGLQQAIALDQMQSGDPTGGTVGRAAATDAAPAELSVAPQGVRTPSSPGIVPC